MKEKEKELQQKYIEFQILEQHIKQIQQQIIALEQQLLELNNIEEGLTQVKETDEGVELLVPLGSGIFVKSELKDKKSVLMNVGANTIVNKDLGEARDIVVQQSESIKAVMSQAGAEFQRILLQNQNLKQEIRQLSSEIKGTQQ